MAKSRDAFRTISEVSQILDTPAHVLRFWESKFTQIRPVKRAGGRRYYRPDDVALLMGIKDLLHDRGMTIKGVQKILREDGVQAVMVSDDALRPAMEDQGAEIIDAADAAPAQASPPKPPKNKKPTAKPGKAQKEASGDAKEPTADLAGDAPHVHVEDPTPQDNIVPFSLDRPALQPSLFDDDPAPGALPDPRSIGALVAVSPDVIAKRAAKLAPMVAQLEDLAQRMRRNG